MQNPRIVIAGLLLALLPSAAYAASGKSLYDDMKAVVELEQADNGYDREIIEYLMKIFSQPEASIKAALAGNAVVACSLDETKKNRLPCSDFVLRVIRTGKKEAAIRRLGRQLQEIAAGEEVPMSYIPGRPVSLFFDLSALVNLWVPGDKAPMNMGKDLSVTMSRLDEATMDGPLTTLRDALGKLNDDEKTGAVWRYDAGIRLVRGERDPSFPKPYEFSQNAPGTDLQLLNKRWQTSPRDIEGALMAIWNALPPDDGIANHITYYVFPKMEEKMPPNIMVWARKGKKLEQGRLLDFADVGLAWKTPYTPVFPSLLKRDSEGVVQSTIPGGYYPPEPVLAGTQTGVDGRKLCSDPVQAKGY
jgi:hypothetical protein